MFPYTNHYEHYHNFSDKYFPKYTGAPVKVVAFTPAKTYPPTQHPQTHISTQGRYLALGVKLHPDRFSTHDKAGQLRSYIQQSILRLHRKASPVPIL